MYGEHVYYATLCSMIKAHTAKISDRTTTLESGPKKITQVQKMSTNKKSTIFELSS